MFVQGDAVEDSTAIKYNPYLIRFLWVIDVKVWRVPDLAWGRLQLVIRGLTGVTSVEGLLHELDVVFLCLLVFD